MELSVPEPPRAEFQAYLAQPWTSTGWRSAVWNLKEAACRREAP